MGDVRRVKDGGSHRLPLPLPLPSLFFFFFSRPFLCQRERGIREIYLFFLPPPVFFFFLFSTPPPPLLQRAGPPGRQRQRHASRLGRGQRQPIFPLLLFPCHFGRDGDVAAAPAPPFSLFFFFFATFPRRPCEGVGCSGRKQAGAVIFSFFFSPFSENSFLSFTAADIEARIVERLRRERGTGAPSLFSPPSFLFFCQFPLSPSPHRWYGVVGGDADV